MPKLEADGIESEVPQGATVLLACERERRVLEAAE
jgi:hypothetical protein